VKIIQKLTFFVCFYLIFTSNPVFAQTPWTEQVYGPDQKNIEYNPLKGIIPGFDYYANSFPYSTEFFYIALNTTYSGWDKYNWTTFEKELTRIGSKGCHAIPRFYIDSPGREYALPLFLQSIVPAHDYTDNGNTTSKSPYWNTDTLMYALEQFITAYGARYDGDPRIGAVEVGLYGFWGEMHNYPHDDWDMVPAKRDRLVKAFTTAFTKTHSLIRYPSLVSTVNLRNSVGYYDDSYLVNTVGSESWYFWNLMVKDGASEAWKKHPMGGELYTVGTPLAKMWDNWPNTVGNDISTCIKTTHHSWFSEQSTFDNTLTDAQWTNKLKAQKMLGYQFFVSSVQIILDTLNAVTTNVKIQNRGVAPFYYNWDVEFMVVNKSRTWSGKLGKTNWNIDSFLPSTDDYRRTFTSDKSLPNGDYNILMRFVNPLESYSPKARPLRFANEKQDADMDGWITLGNVEVKKSFETSKITIDGKLDDWSWIDPIDVKTEQSVHEMKAFGDNEYLYLSIAGSNLGPAFKIYLDTDNNANTGSQLVDFNTSGAEFCLHNSSLSVWTGSEWSDISSNVKVSVNSSATEIQIPKSSLAQLGKTINIAYLDIDANATTVSFIGFSSFSFLPEKPIAIITDGNLSDWSDVTSIANTAGQSAQNLKVHNDAINLYFAVEGTGLGVNYQLYFNTDKDASSGFQHWLFPNGSGAEYMIQDGVLMKSTAQTGWSWATVTANILSFQNSNSTEVKVPRSSLGPMSDSIYVAYVDINNSWENLSELGFAPYLLKTTTEIHKLIEPLHIGIYPNPASETLIITLGESGDLALINIFTIYGQLIYSEHTTNSQMKVDVSGLKTKGLVIVQVDKRQEISNLKVVLQ